MGVSTWEFGRRISACWRCRTSATNYVEGKGTSGLRNHIGRRHCRSASCWSTYNYLEHSWRIDVARRSPNSKLGTTEWHCFTEIWSLTCRAYSSRPNTAGDSSFVSNAEYDITGASSALSPKPVVWLGTSFRDTPPEHQHPSPQRDP